MNIFKSMAVAGALAATSIGGTAATAQAQSVGVLDVESAIRGSQAYQTAIQQLRQQYATQIAQRQERAQALQAEIAPLAQQLQTAAQQPDADQNALRQQQAQLQQRQQAAQQELAQYDQPIALAEAYISEQIQVQLDPAVRAAMQATGTDLVIRPETVVAASNPQAASLTDDTVAQLNQRIQSVAITPPQGWQPGQTLQAAQQAAQPQQ